MEPIPMTHAMGISEILRNIMKYMAFGDLANARLVDKAWNKEANFWFPKRAVLKELSPSPETESQYGSLTALAAFIETESKLRNQELVAKVSGRVSIEVNENPAPYEGLLFLEWIRLKDPRLARIRNLQLNGWSKSDMNRCLPFIVCNLPCLEELELERESELPGLLGLTTQDFTIPADSTSSVKLLSLPMNRGIIEDTDGSSLDLAFLHQCTNLTTLSSKVEENSSDQLSRFVALFKGLSPPFRFDHVVFDFSYVYDLVECRSMFIQFLKVNKPSILTLTIWSSYHLRILRKVAQHIDSVVKFSVIFFCDPYDKMHWGEMVSLRETIPSFRGFPRLSELCIELQGAGGILERRKTEVYADPEVNGFFKNIFDLGGLTKLEVAVTSDPIIERETVIAALFHRSVPQVPLCLKIGGHKSASKPCPEFLFSVQEFQDAVNDASPSDSDYKGYVSSTDDEDRY